MSERRYGKFTIPADWIRQERREVLLVMSYCWVFRAEQLFHTDEIEYHAACSHFREVPRGEKFPEYRWVIQCDAQDKLTVHPEEVKPLTGEKPWTPSL